MPFLLTSWASEDFTKNTALLDMALGQRTGIKVVCGHSVDHPESYAIAVGLGAQLE
jgi:hypothetical protein